MATLELINITKKFGDVTAVDNVSLGVEDGEFVTLLGPSGCGKSTLLNMIAGLEDVTAGEIRISGKTVNQLGPFERDVAMVFQNYALYPHMTVGENIGFSLQLRKRSRTEIQDKVRNVASMLELEKLLHRFPRELSGGQQQRVAIGRAVILVAEPNPRVAHAILVGITPIEVDAEQYHQAQAEKQLAPEGVLPLRRFTMAYCKNNYVATLPAYLSYADWTADVIAGRLGKTRVPLDIVLGTKDQFAPPAWQARLAKTRVPLSLIENAGHFFDGEHEFELNDRVSKILKKRRH